ncbi:hypothetical protein ILYODFUR_013043 [Ilyodon furcidens]|uniref:Uncharacterized protein n=1 Tax=Ilyodon furcidens TaxID=33524 RepID=A0ABV0U813_9TELE
MAFKNLAPSACQSQYITGETQADSGQNPGVGQALEPGHVCGSGLRYKKNNPCLAEHPGSAGLSLKEVCFLDCRKSVSCFDGRGTLFSVFWIHSSRRIRFIEWSEIALPAVVEENSMEKENTGWQEDVLNNCPCTTTE